MHIITNNQVGFTTSGADSRSSENASDIVKSFGIPVLRVNSSDGTTPENLLKIANFCISYHEKYGKDILIDMIGFRKNGHNEVDEPAFTQPQMYSKIRGDFDSVNLPSIYSKNLVD